MDAAASQDEEEVGGGGSGISSVEFKRMTTKVTKRILETDRDQTNFGTAIARASLRKTISRMHGASMALRSSSLVHAHTPENDAQEEGFIMISLWHQLFVGKECKVFCWE